MEYYEITTTIVAAFTTLIILLYLADIGMPRRARAPPTRNEILLNILNAIALGVAIKIIADSFYELLNNLVPTYEGIIKLGAASFLLVVSYVLTRRRPKQSKSRRPTS
jgi:hypothetical protein